MRYILGIETSCDDTSAAVVTQDRVVLSNIVLSQTKEHAPYSGVVPEIASRAHMNYLEFAVKKALDDAGITLNDLTAIAATGGPGLIGGVIVGSTYAKALASVSCKSYIPINHLEGHALTVRLTHNIEFPYLLLLISGGHCQFLCIESFGSYYRLGQTLDDSIGEAFDKVAKMLKLGYPGGPIVEKLAKEGDMHSYKLPLSMCDRSGCDMSFSGLKTAVRLLIEKNDAVIASDICASFQYTVGRILSLRAKNAIKMYEEHLQHKGISLGKRFVISGGVAANKYLFEILDNMLSSCGYDTYAPPLDLCTDNAAMIAWVAHELYGHQTAANLCHSFLDFCPKARWPISYN